MPALRPLWLFAASDFDGYHLNVFSANSPLLLDLLRIGVITLLYLLSIFGWGQLLCRHFIKSENHFPDFIATRLVMGCLALYSLFILLSSEWQRLADAKGYFRLPDEHLSRFYGWIHMLPVSFDDHQGNVLLSVP